MTDAEQRLFTLAEASDLLPTVVPLVEQLRDAQAAMEEIQEEVMTSVPTNGGGRVHRAYQDAASSASEALQELTEMGIIVRAPDSGLIDFPSERDGQIVYLCWRLGEDQIAWWHPPETGFAGRQPV